MAIQQSDSPLSRRTMLQAGSIGLLGPSLSQLATAGASTGKAKSVLFVFLTGGLSHQDSFDMKPNAPDDVRGEFIPVSTATSGLQICEHLPHLAKQADKYAVIRTLSHKDNNHLMSTHHVLTGHLQPGAFFDKVASRDDWPCYSSGLGFLRPRNDGIPSGVNLPTFLLQGPLTWPGQHAGFLGAKYDPWQINGNPNEDAFRMQALSMREGITQQRLQSRRQLLEQLQQ